MNGSRTQKNILAAFAGESQARNRYLFYAKIAKKEGYEQIASIFEETAEHEMSHAKNFFKYLELDTDLEITSSYPGGRIGTTRENLAAAIRGEKEEWSNLYLDYAEAAELEGYMKVASLFKNIAVVEQGHEKRFTKLWERLESGQFFERDEVVSWMCRKCGYIHVGSSAPQICPACYHPQGYFEIFVENY
jgi:rubrerythrin